MLFVVALSTSHLSNRLGRIQGPLRVRAVHTNFVQGASPVGWTFKLETSRGDFFRGSGSTSGACLRRGENLGLCWEGSIVHPSHTRTHTHTPSRRIPSCWRKPRGRTFHLLMQHGTPRHHRQVSQPPEQCSALNRWGQYVCVCVCVCVCDPQKFPSLGFTVKSVQRKSRGGFPKNATSPKFPRFES